MKTKDLMTTKFTWYYRANKAYPMKYAISLMNWLSKKSLEYKDVVLSIRNGEYRLYKAGQIDKRQYQQAKLDLLPASTPSAIFEGRRQIGLEKSMTGIFVIDIDDIDDVVKAKQDVMKLPYVFATTLSVSGEGICCFIYYNKDNDFVDTFRALSEDFSALGYAADQSCKDVTRARYVSYDDNMLIKDMNTEIEMYDKVKKKEKQLSLNSNKEYDNIENGDLRMTKDEYMLLGHTIYCLVKEFGYGTANLRYSNGSLEYTYNEWTTDGYRLSSIGNYNLGLKLFQFISEHSKNYMGEIDVKENYEKFSHYSGEYNNASFYFLLAKQLIGPKWREHVIAYK